MTDSAPRPVRVLLVEDQALVRTGLRMLIDSQPDLTVVGEAGDGVNAVHQARATRPALVVMDERMPILSGIAATGQILALPSPPKVVVLTTNDLDEYALAAIRAGASGILLKDALPEELLAALRAVHSGDAVLAPSTTRRLLDQLAPAFDPDAAQLVATLTAREREVLIEMAGGWQNAEIAERLHVSEGTVKTHVSQILAKLSVRDRVRAVVVAYEAGMVRPGGQS